MPPDSGNIAPNSAYVTAMNRITTAPITHAQTAPGPASCAARHAPNSQPEPMIAPTHRRCGGSRIRCSSGKPSPAKRRMIADHGAGVRVAMVMPLLNPSPCGRGESRRRERLAGKVDGLALGAEHVVLDPDAAVLAERLDLRPYDILRGRPGLQRIEQRVDEVDAGFDRRHHAGFERAGEAQIRMPVRFRDHATAFVAREAADVVHLKPDQVSQPVRAARPSARDGRASAARDNFVPRAPWRRSPAAPFRPRRSGPGTRRRRVTRRYG